MSDSDYVDHLLSSMLDRLSLWSIAKAAAHQFHTDSFVCDFACILNYHN